MFQTPIQGSLRRSSERTSTHLSKPYSRLHRRTVRFCPIGTWKRWLITDSHSIRRHPTPHHHCPAPQSQINLRLSRIPRLCTGSQSGAPIHLRKLCRRPRVAHARNCREIMRCAFVSTALSADANPFGSRQSDGIRNNLRRLPAVDFGWRNSDWARRKFRHYRRSDEGAGRVFSTRARDSKRMVGTNFTLTTRQQIHQFNHPRDAAAPR